MDSKIEKFSYLLFNENETICIGSLFDNNVQSFMSTNNPMFFTVNPIDSRIDHGYKEKESYNFLTPRRADINVSSFRNFIFEMDNESLEDQMSILKGCGIPWTTLVYSGSKSYHAILAVDKCLGGCHTKEGIEQYKNIWKRISLKIEHYANSLGFSNVVDQSGKNPSRFTRYPESVRSNGNVQSIVMLGARVRFEDFQALISTCPKIFVNVVKKLNKLEIGNVEEFFDKAPQTLVDEVKYPMGLQPSGMYPKLLRLSLWAKDLGVDKDLWYSILNYRMFPSLLKIGYPENKLETAINHAYRR